MIEASKNLVLAVVQPAGAIARLGALCVIGIVSTLSLMPYLAVPDGAPNHTDKLVHLAMQGTLGFAVVWAWPRPVLWTAAGLAGLVVVLEVGQIWVPGRSFSVGDLATNAIGAAIGACLAASLGWRLRAQASSIQKG